MKITLNQIPVPPSVAVFRLKKIETVGLPHPYCITPRHVQVASDRFGGILNEEAIRSAERDYEAVCDICYQKGVGILPYDKHESLTTLFIEVPKEFQRDLNKCPGLHSYLLTNKAQMESLGIQGFAFPAI